MKSTDVYTPPPRKKQVRVRPPWHRPIGVVVLLAGLYIVLANIVIEFREGLRLLPTGHKPLYLMLGIAVAISSTWFFGWFDRPR